MKIGASLVRENITNAYDAMNYFNKGRKKNNKNSYKVTNNVQSEEVVTKNVNIDEEEDYENFLKEMAD